ncbi:hypothetical protein V8J88_18860 [Massilia sp. W12]|uniref:hypothetical protein n=1 Tax=Massilia sp. W12 TaxID=3126507 RepID=UPI0030D18E46
MNRFTWLAVALFACSMLAQAFTREFPPESKRGVMTPGVYPEIVLNGKVRLLAVNIQIRNADNLLETFNTLLPGSYYVNYLENEAGEIQRIWILTKDEVGHTTHTGPNPGP